MTTSQEFDEIAALEKLLETHDVRPADLDAITRPENRSALALAVPVLIEQLPHLDSVAARRVALAAAADGSRNLRFIVDEIRRRLRPEFGKIDRGHDGLLSQALDYLAAGATDDLFDDLVELLEDETLGEERARIPSAMEHMDTRRNDAIRILLRHLEHGYFVGPIVETLGRMKATEATPALRALLRSDQAWQRQLAERSLDRLDGSAKGPSIPEGGLLLPLTAEISDLASHETSVELDLVHLGDYLRRLGENLGSISGELIADFVRHVESLEREDESVFRIDLEYRNQPLLLVVEVRMEDPDVLCLAFRAATREPILAIESTTLPE